MSLKNKRILLGVTAGIAAYKSPYLVRLLREEGAQVQVVMSESAKAFIAPLTLQCLSGLPVRSSLFDATDEHAMGHITLARWPDAIVIAPATADCLAKLAHGNADDLLTTLCLATEAPISVVPAMNRQMWSHPATQHNQGVLRKRGLAIWGPASGKQACGEWGEGRMIEPECIVSMLQQHMSSFDQKGKAPSVLITAGPTYEAIDPVRFLGNRSSGKMGYALAEAWQASGAEVTLISGPVAIPPPLGVRVIAVESSQEMAEAVMAEVSHCHIFIGAAAVADYQPEHLAEQKMKKDSASLVLHLKPTLDIINAVAGLSQKPFIVGFAAETEQVIAHAKSKLKRKQLDMIVANQVGNHLGFGKESIEVTLISASGDERHFPKQSKQQLAMSLVEAIKVASGLEIFQEAVSAV